MTELTKNRARMIPRMITRANSWLAPVSAHDPTKPQVNDTPIMRAPQTKTRHDRARSCAPHPSSPLRGEGGTARHPLTANSIQTKTANTTR